MKRFHAVSGVAAVSFLALTTASAFAQDAQAILKKVGDTYGAAKTYQADYTMSNKSPQGASSVALSIKRTGSKMRVDTTISGAGVPGGMKSQLVDDGVNSYTYTSMMNAYTKSPHNPGFNPMSSIINMPQTFSKQAKSMKLLPPATVNGKAAYAIEMTGAKATDGTAVLYVDKANYHMLQLKGNGKGGTMQMDVTNEKFDAPISASAFVFTPPKGAKLMQGGAMPAPGPRK